MVHPLTVTNCNIDMESLISDQNRSIATLAITTLLKTGNESSVERLMKQITSFMSDIQVGLHKVNSADPQLESTWFQPSSLSSDILVSSLCFQMQLVPLQFGEVEDAVVVGLYKLRIQLTHSLKPPDTNP